MKSSQTTDDFGSTVGQTADHFMHRMLEQIMSEATRSYWLRRAQTFAAVGTPACREIAQACRNRAAVAEFEDFREVVTQVVDEVSGGEVASHAA
jgi:hypothetical protein